MTLKVFISSTYKDLENCRQAAIKVVNRYKCVPLGMEFFDSQPGEPETVCEKETQECNIFIGIYAHRYGFIPDGQTKSITQLEYELAKMDKDCLCFIVEKKHPWNPEYIEFKKQKKLSTFLGVIKKEKTCSFFTTVKDFESKISTSLGKLIAEKKAGAEPKDRVGEVRSCIPLAPAPFIAHPYPLPQHFTGRDAEQALLSNWLFNEEEPVLVIEAIGGMGKSALTWVWLQKQILEPGIEIEGVFWWSFYEAPFDTFLNQLSCYVLGKESAEGCILSADLPKLWAVLNNRKFLLVLDGLERALRGYAGMEAMFIQEKRFEEGTTEEDEWDKRQREPVHPGAVRFLKHLSAKTVKTNTLITTRLMPTPLEGLSGVKHVFFKGLSEGDAIKFLRIEGIKGTRSEMKQAGKVYDFHPLMLKLLSSAIKRSRTKDIQEAFNMKLIDRKEPQKILTKSFNLLTKDEQQVASSISIFRSGFTFDAAKALFPDMDEDRLWQVMQELQGLGFLFFAEKQDRFDFHPIMRSFLYHSLTNRAEIHTLAVRYFQSLPEKEKIVSLEDLAPVIELYHHLVKAGKFDKAFYLFRDRLHNPCYFQLSTYRLIIELIMELFPEGEVEDRLPRLAKEADQAWTLNELANTYTISGQPARAVPLYLLNIKLHEKNDKKNLVISLVNISTMLQIHIGQLSASTAHLRKSIDLCREIEDEFKEAASHQGLGSVLAYQGRVKMAKGGRPFTEEELAKSTTFWENVKYYPGLILNSAYRSLSALLQARIDAVLPGEKNHAAVHSMEAVAQAWMALEYLKKDAETYSPLPRDFVHSYWLLGEALIQCLLAPDPGQVKAFEIPFYDEHFQHPVEVVKVSKGSELAAADRCLTEAMRRCRKVNLVEFEPDILLAHARLEWAKSFSILPSVEENLKEAFEISQRSGYRLKLADLHLFCGQVLLELKEKTTLLGLNAYDHLQKTKEYALDVSEFSYLYQSPDPDFYKGIPEYRMLKRGMTREERIQNGYWVAYKIAEELEKKCISMISG